MAWPAGSRKASWQQQRKARMALSSGWQQQLSFSMAPQWHFPRVPQSMLPAGPGAESDKKGVTARQQQRNKMMPKSLFASSSQLLVLPAGGFASCQPEAL